MRECVVLSSVGRWRLKIRFFLYCFSVQWPFSVTSQIICASVFLWLALILDACSWKLSSNYLLIIWSISITDRMNMSFEKLWNVVQHISVERTNPCVYYVVTLKYCLIRLVYKILCICAIHRFRCKNIFRVIFLWVLLDAALLLHFHASRESILKFHHSSEFFNNVLILWNSCCFPLISISPMEVEITFGVEEFHFNQSPVSACWLDIREYFGSHNSVFY